MNIDELTDHMFTATNSDYAKLARLMVECLQLIPFQLPTVASAGIEVAKRYWSDRSLPASELERARVACWDYLDARSASTNTEVPEYCAIRAVICALYPEPPSDDFGELVYCFNEMLRGALNPENYETFAATMHSVADRFSRNE